MKQRILTLRGGKIHCSKCGGKIEKDEWCWSHSNYGRSTSNNHNYQYYHDDCYEKLWH